MGNPERLLRAVAQPLEKYAAAGDTFLVAFSGGPDSVGLSLILAELGYKIELAHVNYQLRGSASQVEQEWVQLFAQRRGWSLHLYVVRPEEWQSHQSKQAQARALRYNWIERLLREKGFRWAATAHTQEDLLETLLYRFVRSAAPQTLQGIPYRRGVWLRPLLGVSRQSVMDFVRACGETFCLDTSNYTPVYLRNQVRWWILPHLQRLNPSLAILWRQRWKLYRLQWRRLHGLYRRQALRGLTAQPYGVEMKGAWAWDAFYAVVWERWGLSLREAQQVWRLRQKGQVGAACTFKGLRFVRVPRGLQVGKAALWTPAWPDLYISASENQYQWGFWKIEVGTTRLAETMPVRPPKGELWWQKSKLSFPLRLRRWKPGDRMAPAGLQGHHKRLSDVWLEVGLYGFARQHAFVVEAADGTLIGAAYYRPSVGLAPQVPDTEIFYLRAAYGESTCG